MPNLKFFVVGLAVLLVAGAAFALAPAPRRPPQGPVLPPPPQRPQIAEPGNAADGPRVGQSIILRVQTGQNVYDFAAELVAENDRWLTVRYGPDQKLRWVNVAHVVWCQPAG